MFNILIPIIIFSAGICMLTGILAGFVITDARLWRGLTTAFRSIFRIILKTMRRRGRLVIDQSRLQRDKDYISLPPGTKTELMDKNALKAIVELRERLAQQYGSRIANIYMYGSRVRGDHRFDSDVDVAIFFTALANDSDKIKKALLFHTCELLLKYGLYIQPRIYDSQVIKEVESSHDYLVKVVFSYGVPV